MKKIHGLMLGLIVAAISVVVPALAAGNVADEKSNPEKLPFQDIEMRAQDFAAPYKRDGVFEKPQLLQPIQAGVATSEVTALLGQPEHVAPSSNGVDWDYNVKLPLPHSKNTLVCQYKVVVDSKQEQVVETVWRRHQCLDIVNGASSMK